jgi:AcrR family transcriptional regulator
VTKGSFYWHFADRETLLSAALKCWEAAERERLDRAAGEDPRGELTALVRSFASGEGCPELRASDGERHAAVAASLAPVGRARAVWIAERLSALGYDEDTAAARALIATGSLVGLRGLRRTHAVSGDEVVAAWLATLLAPAPAASASPDFRD